MRRSVDSRQSQPGQWNAPNLPEQTFPDLPFDGYAECNLEFPRMFPLINLKFPGDGCTRTDQLTCPHSSGLQLIRERPYIFVVNEFLSQEECDALIAKVSHRQLLAH